VDVDSRAGKVGRFKLTTDRATYQGRPFDVGVESVQ